MLKINYCLLLLVWLCSPALARRPLKRSKTHKAIIVLTYDDGLDSQLAHALPQLKRAGFKATFFLTGYIADEALPGWRAAGRKGFELGNHTVFHPCYHNSGNDVAAENYDMSAMLREVDVMNTILFAIDGKNVARTFAYPCADTMAGNKSYVDPLKASGLVSYARLGGDTDAVITDFTRLDPFRVPAYGVDDSTSAPRLIDFARRVESSRGMGIFIFHGIGGDYISVTSEAHQQLLNYLKKHRSAIMVTSFGRAMALAEQRKQEWLARQQPTKAQVLRWRRGATPATKSSRTALPKAQAGGRTGQKV